MKKLLQSLRDHSLLFVTLGLIVFIPLYPKLPVLDVRHTWVYVRLEDFVVLGILLWWAILLVRRRVSLVTPITVPILLFWLIGAVGTIHGILLIYPNLSGAHPNVGFLSMLRRIEYMSLFFVAFAAMKEKRNLRLVIAALALTVFAVSVYGIGQKYLGFPAFLTMNEEFAKGIPIRLSALSRVSSTFSGHYDLAAYFVLTIPILASMVFATRNRIVQAAFLGICGISLLVLFMTVSRISLLALFVAVGIVVFMQKKKLAIAALPAILLAAAVVGMVSPKIVERFGSTVKQIDVLVDAQTGEAIGHTKLVPNTYFADKTVKQVFSRNVTNLYANASPSAALVVSYTRLEPEAVLFVEPNAPTGENLPQGTGYVNLPLAPVTKKLGHFYFEPVLQAATTSAEVFIINGSFLIKKAFAYDLSFTTRFQGEWPRALDTFRRNVFLGSGYGSVGLAVDNSYLRMLGEVGLLGFGAFIAILVMAWLSIKSALRRIENSQTRSFLIGLLAGATGLAINALFIDVFEASKVAFVLWLLVGTALGLVGLYARPPADLSRRLIGTITSPIAIIVFLFVLTVMLYGSMLGNNFVGDDFTWLRWAADCGSNAVSQRCNLNLPTIVRYFTQANGFFYRPGAKVYFLLMYSTVWLNQNAYHAVSLGLHFGVAVLVFLLARKILKGTFMATLAAVSFLLLSGHAEPVFWISATGFLFASFFALLSLVSSIAWHERGKREHFILAVVTSVLSMLFHELGIVTPFLNLLYAWTYGGGRRRMPGKYLAALFAPLPLYLIARAAAGSHWLSGDYNYNLVKFPLNAVGNAIGYFLLSALGPYAGSATAIARAAAREQVVAASAVVFALALAAWFVWKRYAKAMEEEDRRVLSFGVGFFLIALLPFLGLGTMASRYSYLASVAVAILLVHGMKHVYAFLLTSGRTIAILGTLVVASTLGLLQLVEHQQIASDWKDAGEISRRFIVSMEGSYEDYWKREPMEFHFVNLPIRTGEAWVFPVGLPDAIWFIFRSPDIRVFTRATVEAAFSVVNYDDKNQKVFEFTSSGKLVERKKTRNIQ